MGLLRFFDGSKGTRHVNLGRQRHKKDGRTASWGMTGGRCGRLEIGEVSTSVGGGDTGRHQGAVDWKSSVWDVWDGAESESNISKQGFALSHIAPF